MKRKKLCSEHKLADELNIMNNIMNINFQEQRLSRLFHPQFLHSHQQQK